MSQGSSLRRLRALCRKESFQIVRDPSSVLIAFILPIALLFIFGYGINLDASRLRIGVVVESRSTEAIRLATAFAGSPLIQAIAEPNRSAAQADLIAGAVRGYVVVPEDFADRLHQPGGIAVVQVVTDGSEPNTANFVEAYSRGVWRTWKAQRAADRGAGPATGVGPTGGVAPGIDLVPRYWFNPSTVSRNSLVPGSIVIVMTVVGALLTSLVVAREWERGTMEALLATPVTRTELLLSKLLPYYLLGLFSMTVCVVIAIWILGVPFRGSWWVLYGMTSLFLGSALGLGLWLSTVTRNQFNAAQGALNAAFLPSLMLSGFVYEISSMPTAVQALTLIIPARYFVSSLQTLFQAGDIGPLLWRDALFLGIAAAVFLGLTARATKRRLD